MHQLAAKYPPFTGTSCVQCGSAIRRRLPKTGRCYCNTTCKAEWQKTQRPVTVEWLHQKYVVEGLDCTAISKLVGRDSKSVWNWLKGSGIETRKRGFSSPSPFVKGGVSPFKGRKHTDEVKEKIRQCRVKDGRIPAYINGVHWLKATGRRPAAWRGGITPERQAFYATPEWKECVKAVWQRDDAKCQKCGLDHRTVLRGIIRFDIHHIDGFSIVERRSDVTNLVLLCQKCHKWVHSKKNKKGVLLGKGHRPDS